MLRLGKVIFSGKTSDLLAKQQPVIVAKPENTSDLTKLVQIATAAGHEAVIIENTVHVTGTSDFSLIQSSEDSFICRMIRNSIVIAENSQR